MSPSSEQLVLRGSIACGLAGLAYLGEAFVYATSPLGLLQALVALLAALLTIPAVVGIHAWQREHYGDLGATGYTLALGALGLQVVGLLLSLVRNGGLSQDRTEGVLYSVGFLGLMVGLLLLGLATLRSERLPLWCGAVLVVIGPLALLPYPDSVAWLGLVILGAGLLAVAAALGDRGVRQGWSGRAGRRDRDDHDEDHGDAPAARSRFDRPPFRRKASSD